ncbi:MAG: DNA-deoxyinosine glycosylase [Rhodoferax sp.]|nr:DNA-deoxyinosine glycosylase [Rhodoferax sp.]
MVKKTADKANADTAPERLVGLPALVGDRTRLLILGSFPGVRSLGAQQYYGHPQNHFWRIVYTLLGAAGGADHRVAYDARSQFLLDHGLGLWDVYASCEREGSLDSRIRNAVVNDFAALRQRCPQLLAVAHNGAESFRFAPLVQALGVPVHKLPSTSPANASWSFERKLAAWREVFELYGLT